MKKVILSLVALSTISWAQVSKLAATDSLDKVVQHFNQEWNDGNITTGTTQMRAGKWTVATSTLEKTLSEMLASEVKKQSDNSGKLSKIQTVSKNFSKQDVFNLTRAFAEGNDYSLENKEDFVKAMGQVYAVLAKLSNTEGKDVLTVTAKAVYKEDGEARNVSLTSFTSTTSGKTVLFFIIQGRM